MTEKKKDIFDKIMLLPGIKIFQPIYVKYKEVLLYLFFGGLTFLVSIGTYAFFNVKCEINELVSNLLSWIAAVLFAYITNRIWVFQSSTSGVKECLREAVSFFSGRIFTLLVEEIILLIFVTVLGLNSLLVKVAAQIIVIILNYVISKKFVFREK